MELTQEQIMNWRREFPMLSFFGDELVRFLANRVREQINAETRIKELFAANKHRFPRKELFDVLRVGSVLAENKIEKRVTRLTDRVFDTINLETGEVEVRGLELLRNNSFINSVSILLV